MRKLIFGGAISLDGYLARPDHAVDWILWGEEAADVMKDYWKPFDAVVMGRKTFEIAAKGGGDAYPGMKTFVTSRSMKEAPNGVTLIRDDAAGFIRKLKAEEGKDICLMGGGDLAKSLFEADLIDEIGFNIHPVLLGAGVPLFHEMRRQIDLDLKECRPFRNGCAYVVYRVKCAV